MIELESRVVTFDEIQRIHRCDSSSPAMILLKSERDGWRWVVGNDMMTNYKFWSCPYCRCDLGDLKNSEVTHEST